MLTKICENQGSNVKKLIMEKFNIGYSLHRYLLLLILHTNVVKHAGLYIGYLKIEKWIYKWGKKLRMGLQHFAQSEVYSTSPGTSENKPMCEHEFYISCIFTYSSEYVGFALPLLSHPEKILT